MKRTPEREIVLLFSAYVILTVALVFMVGSLLHYIAPRIVDQLPRVNIQITPRVQD
jgi:hypothetical protein